MFAALVLITTLVLLAVVWNSTSKSITGNLSNRLALAETVVMRELANRQQALIRNAHILVDNAEFNRAIASNNNENILEAIESYRSLIAATFVSVRNNSGVEIKSTGSFYQHSNIQQAMMAIANTNIAGETTEIVVYDNSIMLVLYLPIINNKDEADAYTAIGFNLGKAYLQSLKDIVLLDISFVVKGEKTVIVSSLPAHNHSVEYLDESLYEKVESSFLNINSLVTTSSLFSRKFSKPNMGSLGNAVYLSADATAFKAQFLQLQVTIGAIALIALVMAMLAGKLLSRQITRPLEYMANYAVNISKGDYSTSFELDACSLEIDQLSIAFRSMEDGVKQRESEIQFQARHDMLTNLYNRSYFTEHLTQLFDSGQCFQAIGINISGFRAINDVFGYHYGDACVKELAQRIQCHGGVSARITGGEIVWLPNKHMQIQDIEHFKASIDKTIQVEKINVPISTCMGVINCPSDTHNAEDLLRRMNIVIDEAKLTCSLIAHFSHDFEDRYLRRLAIVENLRNALTSNSSDLSIAYQPKLNLINASVKNAEALIRWNDETLGFVPPDEFIAIAEQAGLIHQVTLWVLEQVAMDIQSFKKQGLDMCVAVNISAHDLLDETFAHNTKALLNKYELSNNDISFELTESAIVQDPEKAISQMQALQDEGFSLAIDDFGTGYSSLSYITMLPVDTIKIDKCFVMPLATSKAEQSICKAVLQLAKNFNMQVVAEGVEDLQAMKLLKSWGCEYAQGYHISRPIPARDLVEWVKQKNIDLPHKYTAI